MTVSWLVQAARSVAVLAVMVLAAPGARAEAATAARSSAQLEQLVAPVALYPDSLLSQILMASTYPLEVIEAARWSQQNEHLTGQALEDAMQKQPWDPSVKSLTAVPQVLKMMNDKLDWMQQLGDAFLAQQQDLLVAVQHLRARAEANGQLDSNEHQKVVKLAPSSAPAPATGGATQAPAPAPAVYTTPVYTIEPTDPGQYHVPIYDPGTVYGAWPYADYPPFYWTPPGYYGGTALTFAAGVVTGAAIWGGVDWWRNRANVNVNNFNRFNRTNIGSGNNIWAHNPAHRGGVPYRDQGVAQRFGDPSKAAARETYRGKADAGRRDLSNQGGANRAQGATNRASGQTKSNAAKARQAGSAKGGQAKSNAAQARQGGAKQGATAKKQAKQAGSKQGARGQQAARSKQAARPQQARSAAKPAQRASSPRPQARHSAAGARPAGANRAMQARPTGMRAGGRAGGMRAGGGRRR
jgi:hypothetical protein